MTASEWLAAVQAAMKRYFPDSSFHTQIVRGTRVKVRIEISDTVIADLFFAKRQNGQTML